MDKYDKFDISLGLKHNLRVYVDKFFSQENDQVSPVKTIGLFKKYKKLIETHENYQKIAEWVACQYERLDLLDQTVALLVELSRKTDDKNRKIELQLKIGNLHVKNRKSEAAIKILSQVYPEVPESTKNEVAQTIAKAYLLKKNYEEAIKWLERNPAKENKRLIVDIYIAKEDYAKVIISLMDYLSCLKGSEDDDLREIGLLQLAAAYYVQGDFTQLKSFCSVHKEFMDGRKNVKIFSMLCRPRAQELQSSLEVRDYINDADVIKEILASAEKLVAKIN